MSISRRLLTIGPFCGRCGETDRDRIVPYRCARCGGRIKAPLTLRLKQYRKEAFLLALFFTGGALALLLAGLA